VTASVARHYDVAVVGAGPVGAVAALAHARRGARVALCEANPSSARRLAGEWLHPPAIQVLHELGIDLPSEISEHARGQGFVVFPDDGSAPCLLPYGDGALGYSCRHQALVETLRLAAASHPGIEYRPGVRVRRIEGRSLHYTENGGSGFLSADRIVGADGRGSIVRTSLGLSVARSICSRMVGLLLPDAELPFEGYGHVLLGGPGPVLAYRIAPRHVRLILDVPLHGPAGRERAAFLWDGYADVLPGALRAPFRRVLSAGAFEGAANGVRARRVYGRGDRFLVGDAVGYHHPLTAVGMALGFKDALCLAHCQSVAEYRARRRPASRVAELLAVGLYEALADSADEAVATRRAIYAMWRRRAAEGTRTMGYLACRDTRVIPFAWAFSRTIGRALRSLGGAAWRSGQWGYAGRVAGALLGRLRWLAVGILSGRARGESRPAPRDRAEPGRGVRTAPPSR
jgi:2-polyprenyl-6-methoxyphenol hydroxylase-like FAD-dependent oxidoreductase